ncbi:glycoside hydrolase family 85 protein [Laetiporus sulphureus 93-53]|uniref:Glycoside hydrolase family 85 protein n=1 Tax=Laetiporus sulphureus 93-53 TaxID=1314785 RepID=A0A165ILE9_9APHY|nr:glycoside hydrolase family 85 protein [Laetiporus sulphureus 93-53]KZT13242.1 glycoside hydrolase family 85 protein [Laetiporus sulphureus 93-53]
MPLRGSNHSENVLASAPYFKSLEELDIWAERAHARLTGIIEYTPREAVDGVESESAGKLLVCHDYKAALQGGYTESPSGFAYTFNFWYLCDTFIYFSHHRVTIPPPGWINAAHRQGVKILGTLIFEDSGQQDCLRLLVGRLPKSKTGAAKHSASTSLPLSPHYARLLADLAFQRGFDGYLLNVECPLLGGIEQTRVFSAWIALLESELRRKVGQHAEVIWYDSVIISGDLRWQDRLNNYNLPLFIPSSGFFTNYTWAHDYPSLTAQYFLSLDPSLMPRPKRLRDIYVGVDVWGRGQHGGGGFGSFRAISHIDPVFLGLSVALFGHAWTWETEQDKPGFTWETWWEYERRLWVGPRTSDEVIALPPDKRRQGEPECQHGPFVPLSSFFARKPPPNPVNMPFLTWFSPGIGRAWFVNGIKVHESDEGWTDLDKNSSLGDMVWPRPVPKWEHADQGEPPTALTTVCMDDAWLGGSSLRLSLSTSGSDAEDAMFQCIWLPVHSLAISPHTSYVATVIFRTASKHDVDLDVGLSVKALTDSVAEAFDIRPVTGSGNLPNGWSELMIEFSIATEPARDVLAAVGLIIGFTLEDSTKPVDFFISLGLLAISPSVGTSGISVHQPRVLWADFDPATADNVAGPFIGTLKWEVAASFAPLKNITISRNGEDPTPLWSFSSSFPSFSFFNIYIVPHAGAGHQFDPNEAVWIGTTGLTGNRNSFYVDAACLPENLKQARAARFYLQGVSDRGCVLSWEDCAYVDIDAPATEV